MEIAELRQRIHNLKKLHVKEESEFQELQSSREHKKLNDTVDRIANLQVPLAVTLTPRPNCNAAFLCSTVISFFLWLQLFIFSTGGLVN